MFEFYSKTYRARSPYSVSETYMGTITYVLLGVFEGVQGDALLCAWKCVLKALKVPMCYCRGG